MNGTNFNLDINSALIIVGVLIILYFLKLIMNNQESLAKKLSKREGNKYDTTIIQTSNESETIEITKKGSTKGDVIITGDISEEVMAVIMASVSEYSKIPLKSLKIKSIKKL